jgi:DNA-binding response OmpR family regulator
MQANNESPKRCLILSTHPEIQNLLIPLFKELHMIPDFVQSRKNALNHFLQYKHSLVVIDASFLPRFSYRLVQIFKIAHREPAVVVLNDTGKSLAGFEQLDGYCVRVVDEPFAINGLRGALADVADVMRRMVQAAFMKNLLVQVGVLVPLVGLIVYFLIRGCVVP